MFRNGNWLKARVGDEYRAVLVHDLQEEEVIQHNTSKSAWSPRTEHRE